MRKKESYAAPVTMNYQAPAVMYAAPAVSYAAPVSSCAYSVPEATVADTICSYR